jgi:adenylate kinase
MKIILIGPPGSGKGSQAKKIEKEFSIPHISTGNIFRTLMYEDSNLGKKVYEYMSKAYLVPDRLVMQVVQSYLKEGNNKEQFLFDGFPRTLYQAMELDKIVDIDVAILLDTTLPIVAERILTRRICACGEVYNTKTYHKNVCQVCNRELTLRKDDNIETITHRFKEYEMQTIPVIEHYKQKGKLQVINASLTIEEVYEAIENIIKSIV